MLPTGVGLATGAVVGVVAVGVGSEAAGSGDSTPEGEGVREGMGAVTFCEGMVEGSAELLKKPFTEKITATSKNAAPRT
jgi:hypothetical protein